MGRTRIYLEFTHYDTISGVCSSHLYPACWQRCPHRLTELRKAALSPSIIYHLDWKGQTWSGMLVLHSAQRPEGWCRLSILRTISPSRVRKMDLLCLKTAQFSSQLQPGHPDDCRDFLGAPASVSEMGSVLSVPSLSKMIPEARDLFAHQG